MFDYIDDFARDTYKLWGAIGLSTRGISMNLWEGLIAETNRNRELKKEYDNIPAGAFEARAIQIDIDRAEEAMNSGNVVAMLKIYNTLKDNK